MLVVCLKGLMGCDDLERRKGKNKGRWTQKKEIREQKNVRKD